MNVTASTSNRRRATLAAMPLGRVETRVLWATALAITIVVVHPHGAEHTGVEAALTTPDDLSDTARQALMREADAIWRDAGVRLTWVDPHAARTASQPALRVIVGRSQDRHADAGVVGELLRFDNGDATAIASIDRAAAIVRAAGGGAAYGLPDAIVQHRLGTVLGRAVAHEIGHYLLGSAAHASHGLMRARFQPGEFTDLRGGAFELDAASRRRLQQRPEPSVTTIARADREPRRSTP
jgi:hypothetical protein